MSPTHFTHRLVALSSLLLVLAWVTSPIQVAAQQKIGTVDLKKIFEGYYKTKQADTLLQDSATDADKVLKGMMDEYQKANEDYKKMIESANDQAISAEERDKRKKNAESKILEIKEIEKSVAQFRNEARTRIDEQKRRMRDKILAEIRDTINAKAKLANYALVLDISGESFNNQTQLVMFSNGQYDLTEEILTDLNRTAPAGLLDGAATEKPAPAATAPSSVLPAKAGKAK